MGMVSRDGTLGCSGVVFFACVLGSSGGHQQRTGPALPKGRIVNAGVVAEVTP